MRETETAGGLKKLRTIRSRKNVKRRGCTLTTRRVIKISLCAVSMELSWEMNGRGLLASNFSQKESVFCYIWPMKKESQSKDEECI